MDQEEVVNRGHSADWPPGTIQIEDTQVASDTGDKVEIILSPKPSTDPNDPLNWKTWEKHLNFGQTLLYTFLFFSAFSVTTPTWAPMNIELGFSYETLLNSYAVGSGALCLGGLAFIPFALKFGRRPTYVISILLQIAIAIWAARIQTITDLMMTSAFNCLLGALAEVIVQMTIADVFFVHQRGRMNSLYAWTTVIGPALSPVAAGYVTEAQGWRWVWWWITIILGLCLVIFIFLYEETMLTPPSMESVPSMNQSTNRQAADQKGEHDLKKDQTLELGLGCVSLKVDPSIPHRTTYWRRLALLSDSKTSWRDLMWHMVQPLLVLFTIPAVLYAAVIFGIASACIQITATVLSTEMPLPPYNFAPDQIGLMSLPPLIGSTIVTILIWPINDRFILFLAKRNDGVYEPEMRLWLVLAFSPLIPAGLLVFGYGLANGSSWLIVATGSALVGGGLTPVTSMVLTYITDGYTEIIADGMVGVVFLRNVFATIFIFALTPWIEGVGMGNMFLMFAIITIVLFLSTIGFLVYGKRLRALTSKRYYKFARRQIPAYDGIES